VTEKRINELRMRPFSVTPPVFEKIDINHFGHIGINFKMRLNEIQDEVLIIIIVNTVNWLNQRKNVKAA
jgi:hypothetical protein